MSNWNSYEYRKRERTARRDYRCDACGETIKKGDKYESAYGGRGHEHLNICPEKTRAALKENK